MMTQQREKTKEIGTKKKKKNLKTHSSKCPHRRSRQRARAFRSSPPVSFGYAQKT
jgi:hypothetical protein